MIGGAGIQRRGFTLIEAIIAIVVLSTALPPVMILMDDAARIRFAAVNAERATWLAIGVMEHVIADVASDDLFLGFGALADPPTYVDDPTTGLRVRLASMTGLYEAAGLAYTLSIGPLVSSTGLVTGNANADVYRTVTVNVTFVGASGAVTMSVSRMVSDL